MVTGPKGPKSFSTRGETIVHLSALSTTLPIPYQRYITSHLLANDILVSMRRLVSGLVTGHYCPAHRSTHRSLIRPARPLSRLHLETSTSLHYPLSAGPGPPCSLAAIAIGSACPGIALLRAMALIACVNVPHFRFSMQMNLPCTSYAQ